MKTIEIYKNYGCLASEKKPVYTYGAEHCHAVCSDRITVKVPDGWEVSENNFGETIINPAGCKYWYSANELLSTGKDGPCFSYYDGHKKVTVKLEEFADE